VFEILNITYIAGSKASIRKEIQSSAIVAINAVAHKLCRACYYIIKDQVAFDLTKAFAGEKSLTAGMGQLSLTCGLA
jgi:hypothetical protein